MNYISEDRVLDVLEQFLDIHAKPVSQALLVLDAGLTGRYVSLNLGQNLVSNSGVELHHFAKHLDDALSITSLFGYL